MYIIIAMKRKQISEYCYITLWRYNVKYVKYNTIICNCIFLLKKITYFVNISKEMCNIVLIIFFLHYYFNDSMNNTVFNSMLLSIHENQFGGNFCCLPSTQRRIIRERKRSDRPRLTAEQDTTTIILPTYNVICAQHIRPIGFRGHCIYRPDNWFFF